MLAQHACAQDEQDQQPHGQGGLDHHQRGQKQGRHLKRPARDRHPGAGEPPPAAHELAHQRQAQAVGDRNLARVERLEGDPYAVQAGGDDRRTEAEQE